MLLSSLLNADDKSTKEATLGCSAIAGARWENTKHMWSAVDLYGPPAMKIVSNTFHLRLTADEATELLPCGFLRVQWRQMSAFAPT